MLNLVSPKEEAHRLWEEGLTILPAHPLEKRPLVSWHQWQNSEPPDSLVNEWLSSSKWDNCNFAIVTGKQITVIDCDSEAAEIWVKANLPFTPRTVKTGRGRHYYFKTTPNFEIRNSTNADAKIDVRGTGGIVIAPGSRHSSGAIYTEEITEGFERDWRELPPLCEMDIKRIDQFNLSGNLNFDPADLGVNQGARNDEAARKAGHLINQGYTHGEVLQNLLDWNGHNSPPLSRQEIVRTAQSVQQTHNRKEEKKELVTQETLDELAHAMQPKPFDLVDFASIPAREWVYGRHFIRKFLSVTVAGGGTGKTSLLMAECVAMATGLPLLGVETEKRRVWIWNLEDPLEELHRRLAAIMIHYNIKPEDYAESLFVNSGRDDRLVVTQTINNIVVASPVVNLLIEFITKAEIDVLVIDPFVSTHDVSENDNQAINTVVTQWAKIADKANCSIELVHHTRKAQQNVRGSGSFDDARGASALTDKARHVRRIAKMTPDEARLAGIEESNAWRFTREADSKDNLAPPTGDNSWRQMCSVTLPNGDSVGVIEPWEWPDPFSDITVGDLNLVKSSLMGGEHRLDVRAKNWYGHAVGDALGLDTSESSVKSTVKQLMSTWLTNKEFEIYEVSDKSRRKFKHVRPLFNVDDDAPF